MNDSELIRICRQIQRHNSTVYDLIVTIEESDHPNAAKLSEDLWGQCWSAAWADHVVADYLKNPDKWETGDFGIRRKRIWQAGMVYVSVAGT